MKNSRVIVPWREGLHLRQAAKLVHLARLFRSAIFLKCGTKIADLRSIFSIISLCATPGTAIEVEAIGDDEQDATRAVEQVFSTSAQDGIFSNSTQPGARQYFPN
jgi:phosphocarrier protein HPr